MALYNDIESFIRARCARNNHLQAPHPNNLYFVRCLFILWATVCGISNGCFIFIIIRWDITFSSICPSTGIMKRRCEGKRTILLFIWHSGKRNLNNERNKRNKKINRLCRLVLIMPFDIFLLIPHEISVIFLINNSARWCF